MTTELKHQINVLTNKISDLYGDSYSTQYEYAMNDIQNNVSVETTHIIVDLIDLTLNDDYKQKQINALKKDVKDLKDDIKILKEDNIKKDIRINKLEKENNELKQENKELKAEIKELKDDKQKFDALVKLHECNALVNKEFKRLYKIRFNKKKGEYIPNIGDFIEESPSEDDGEDYEFWLEFNKKYPESNNNDFRMIYRQIANDRADSGAHVNVRKLDKIEFDKLIEIVYPEEYNANKELYKSYRDWLFTFPV
jgi:cell division protein FtsB